MVGHRKGNRIEGPHVVALGHIGLAGLRGNGGQFGEPVRELLCDFVLGPHAPYLKDVAHLLPRVLVHRQSHILRQLDNLLDKCPDTVALSRILGLVVFEHHEGQLVIVEPSHYLLDDAAVA